MNFMDPKNPNPRARPSSREPSGMSPCIACSVRDLAVCSALKGNELEQLNAVMRESSLSKGDYLFSEGDEANFVFIIFSGVIQLDKLLADGRRQITGFLFKGDLLGLAKDGIYTCSAEAISDVQICKFKLVEFENLIEEFPELEHQLLKIARNELAEIQQQLLLLGRKTAIERLASFIISLSDRAVIRGEPDTPVSISMTRNSIGDYLGLTTESVSRSMTRLKKFGAIFVDNEHQRINILNRDKLEELTGEF